MIGAFLQKVSAWALIAILAATGNPAVKDIHTEDSTSAEIPKERKYEKQQLRAAWISTVYNLDWPSKKGLSSAEQKKQYMNILDDMKSMGMNAVIVQIRPTSDAFYPSEYVPWSEYLTGKQGQAPNPYYDPLAFMIEETHKRNMEFHAWFNPYRISMNDNLENLAENHPAKKYPNWVVKYDGKAYYNPGIPEAKNFIIDNVMEVVKNYDIDAIHFDDYFYPYISPQKGDFPDDAVYQKYGAYQFSNKAAWRRNNVNTFVRELSAAIKNEKSYVKFGISPFGVWRNQSVDATGSDTKAGITCYDNLYADVREWISQGWIDYIAPQIYWNIGYEPAAYEKLVDWWANETAGQNVHLYIGHAAYRINNGNEAWANPEELPNQLRYNLNFDQVNGSMFFRAAFLRNNPLGIKEKLQNDIFTYPALIPPMTWIDNEAPTLPQLQSIEKVADTVQLKWAHKDTNDVAYYVIYRFAGDQVGDIEDAKNIVATVRNNLNAVQTFTDTNIQYGKHYTYGITAVDRLHNESEMSTPITID